jgi:radical SAM superfamily enzyme YgiQ (UPF0313 family)
LKDEHQLLLLDCAPKKISLKETIAKISVFSPDLIFLSTATPTLKNDLGWFAPAIKKNNPGLKIAAIGIHVSVLPKEILQEYPALDFIIKNEPEITAKELVSILEKKKLWKKLLVWLSEITEILWTTRRGRFWKI